MTGSLIFGSLNLNDTVAVTSYGSVHGPVTAETGATLAESVQRGVASFVSVTHVAVVFPVKQPDTDYVVGLEPTVAGLYVSARSVTGFTITAGGTVSIDVPWTVTRF